jgi:tetratricopeptide (TPR) repeat protein
MKKACVAWIVVAPVIFVLLNGCSTTFMDNFTLGQGMGEFNKGEYDKAIPSLKKAAESAPKDGWNFWRLGVVYCKNGQYQEAVDALKRYLDLPHDKGSEWTGWMYLADAYDGLGQTDLAISATKKRVELTPDSVYGFLKLSKLYKDNKQYDEAITAAKRAIELKSDNDVAYNNLGAAYGMKKQYDEAIKALKKAIEINPKMSKAYGWMGRFLMEQNAYNEAVEAYKKGIEAAPSIPNLHADLAITYYRMGRYDDALATVNKAIELLTIPGGVGIGFIGIKDNYPVVKEVMNAGPAKKADIQIGDKII